MSGANAALRKLMRLSDRRVESAERALARASANRDTAERARQSAEAALAAERSACARERTRVLDRFVGQPTRAVGVSDLQQMLREIDQKVQDADAAARAAKDALARAEAQVAEMARALKAAQLIRTRRDAAFTPALKLAQARADAKDEMETEEEFGHAGRR